MPVYCFEDTHGEVHDRVFPIGKAPKSIVVRGKKAIRCFAAERKTVQASSCWPMECVASGVNASQAGELRDYLAKSGVPTDVSSDGNPIYKNPRHRKKALKARGMFDKSSYI